VNRVSGKWPCIFLTVFAAACTASRSSAPRAPEGSRVVPTSAAGPWAFAHSPGTRAYRISRTATVEGMADLVVRRETVRNLTHEVLTFEPIGEELGVRAAVDTFTSNTEGAVGPPQPVELPIHLAGALGPSAIRIESPPGSSCNAARTTIATDLHNLVVPFPAQLSKGATWRDAITVSGCQAGIPITTTTTRKFTVSGEVVYSGQPFVVVQRRDSLTARGEGAYNQHRMLVEGTGVGGALYYLDSESGEISWLTTSQSFRIKVTTSGRPHWFTQTASQEFARVR
jgi:hypothetical protein